MHYKKNLWVVILGFQQNFIDFLAKNGDRISVQYTQGSKVGTQLFRMSEMDASHAQIFGGLNIWKAVINKNRSTWIEAVSVK